MKGVLISPLSPLEYVIQVSHTPPDRVLPMAFTWSHQPLSHLLDQWFSTKGDFARAHLTMLETFAAVMAGGANGNNQREGCCCTSYNTQNRQLQQNVIQSKIYRAKFEKGYYCPVTQSRPTLCNLMDCSMPGLSVLHYLPEFAQTHVHWEKAMAPHSSTLAWKIHRQRSLVGCSPWGQEE